MVKKRKKIFKANMTEYCSDDKSHTLGKCCLEAALNMLPKKGEVIKPKCTCHLSHSPQLDPYDRCWAHEPEMVEIMEYFDNNKGLHFRGTVQQFEEFKKFHGMYPYGNN